MTWIIAHKTPFNDLILLSDSRVSNGKRHVDDFVKQYQICGNLVATFSGNVKHALTILSKISSKFANNGILSEKNLSEKFLREFNSVVDDHLTKYINESIPNITFVWKHKNESKVLTNKFSRNKSILEIRDNSNFWLVDGDGELQERNSYVEDHIRQNIQELFSQYLTTSKDYNFAFETAVSLFILSEDGRLLCDGPTIGGQYHLTIFSLDGFFFKETLPSDSISLVNKKQWRNKDGKIEVQCEYRAHLSEKYITYSRIEDMVDKIDRLDAIHLQ